MQPAVEHPSVAPVDAPARGSRAIAEPRKSRTNAGPKAMVAVGCSPGVERAWHHQDDAHGPCRPATAAKDSNRRAAGIEHAGIEMPIERGGGVKNKKDQVRAEHHQHHSTTRWISNPSAGCRSQLFETIARREWVDQCCAYFDTRTSQGKEAVNTGRHRVFLDPGHLFENDHRTTTRQKDRERGREDLRA